MDTPPPMASQNVVAFLRRPESYPEQSAGVKLIETHISWVFLTDAYAYKLKKPVRFEFLDFSTPQLRCQACADELRLNRRLAADVYLEVIPVTATADGIVALGGSGTPIDWVVKMRRLQGDRSLDRLIVVGGLLSDDVDRLAGMLAQFFTRATPVAIEPEQFRAAIGRHVQANAAELADPAHGVDSSLVQRVCTAHLRFLRLRPGLFDARVRDGRVIEGHGDLRPEHVYFEGDQPVVIDCVEFSYELRTLDVADELGFLAMECDRLGGAAVGGRIVDDYQQQSGDAIPAALLHFYKSYRACVRAKVTALRGRQLSQAQQPANREVLRGYLALADQHARRILPPLLLVVRGLMGSGKSTLARAMAEALGLTMFSTDEIRRNLYPAPPKPADYGEGLYEAERRRRVYEEMLVRAQGLIDAGMAVALDGTFLTNELRSLAVEIARPAGALALIVTCHCPAHIAKQRIAARQATGGSLSDARAELLDIQQREEEPISGDLPHLRLDTTVDVATQVEAIIDRLAAELAAVGRQSQSRWG